MVARLGRKGRPSGCRDAEMIYTQYAGKGEWLDVVGVMSGCGVEE